MLDVKKRGIGDGNEERGLQRRLIRTTSPSVSSRLRYSVTSLEIRDGRSKNPADIIPLSTLRFAAFYLRKNSAISARSHIYARCPAKLI